MSVHDEQIRALFMIGVDKGQTETHVEPDNTKLSIQLSQINYELHLVQFKLHNLQILPNL